MLLLVDVLHDCWIVGQKFDKFTSDHHSGTCTVLVHELSVLIFGFLDNSVSFTVLQDLDLIIDFEMEANLLIG